MKLFSFLILFSFTTYGQIIISGTVKNKKKEPLSNATVAIQGSYDGTVVDSLGHFSFSTFETGVQILEVKIIGYKTISNTITLNKEISKFEFILQEQINELDAVVISAGSFEASDRKRSVAVLNSIDIATTGGAVADLSITMNTLPGAQRIGEQEGLFVRGGTNAETKQFIDGSMVPNPYNTTIPNVSSRSRFSAFLFKGTIFSSGGFSALYGQAMSSALILESIDLPEKSEASFTISPVFINSGFQKLSKNKKNSFGINYGHTNLFLYFNLIKQRPDYFQNPLFNNSDFNFRHKTKGGIVKFYSSFSNSIIGANRANIDSVQLKESFLIRNHIFYNNFMWRENFKNNLSLQLNLSFNFNIDKIKQEIQTNEGEKVFTNISYIDDRNVNVISPTKISQIKFVLEKRTKNLGTIRWGGEHWYSDSKYTNDDRSIVLKDKYSALFGEADIYLSNYFTIKAGIRYEYSSLLNLSAISPRYAMAYKLGKGVTLSGSYGHFYQKPEEIYLLNSTLIGFTKATHYMVNIQKITTDYTFRVEGFLKEYNNLVKIEGFKENIPIYSNSGKGDAKGVELFWRDKKTFRGIDYWVSYSFLDTKRNYLNYAMMVKPPFAAKHTLNIVMKKFVLDWKTGFNFTYSYASGRPYYFLPNNDIGAKYKGTTSSYNSLDFSLNYLPNLGKSGKIPFIVLIASATNLLNQKQEYGYIFSNSGNNKQMITSPAARFYFIGCMISFGTDRTQEAINNNL